MKLMLDPAVAARIATDDLLWRDFNDICDCGGRLAGTDSEKRAFALLRERVRAASPANSGRSIPVPYNGWKARHASLVLANGVGACAHPLVRTIATAEDGLTAEVIDLGRGTPEEFSAHASEVRGRIVLVRHELMFAAGTIHRRRKYDMARAAGAVGFLIAGPLPGHVVAGSSGRDRGEGIPALGIAPETAAKLARTASGWPTATMKISTEEGPAETETLVYDYPGQTDEWVVLSAHVDGHDLAESAMDNGTGLAAVLSATRALAPEVANWRRGLRVMFFSVEEWALTGSAQYVQAMSETERAKIALNVNLDSVAGSPNLAALSSDYPGVEPFCLQVAAANGQSLRTVRPLMTNSDHANFAQGGIPAIRLVAGFDDPNAHLRVVLTPADTRDKVAQGELRQATLLTAALVAAACTAEPADAAEWRIKS
ncbi:MAG: M28 family peptidase [Alphaproteobacteria bacterium]|nr:M28 family peptidase [Alphaproteobacteria bacterium]